jgi:cobalt-zinc-cadmium efflux system outer membrane protein
LEVLARRHPEVRTSHLKAQAAQQKIEATHRQNLADPTLGIAAGREDREGLIGISLSVPLQLRNDYGNEIEVSRAEALQAERLAQQAFRDALARLHGALQRFNLISDAWSTWLSEGRTSLRRHLDLLEVQWEAGEMDTTDYLVQFQQSLDTRIAGVRLRGELWDAWIEWLSASNELDQWLETTAEQ